MVNGLAADGELCAAHESQAAQHDVAAAVHQENRSVEKQRSLCGEDRIQCQSGGQEVLCMSRGEVPLCHALDVPHVFLKLLQQ